MPRPPGKVSYEAGCAIIGSPNAQSVRLNKMEVHQSLVGMAPWGASAVRFARGFNAPPHPVGRLAPAGNAVVYEPAPRLTALAGAETTAASSMPRVRLRVK